MFEKFILIMWSLVLLLFLNEPSLADDCGKEGKTSLHRRLGDYISGGDIAPPNKYPWMVHIEFSGNHCGGSLITDRHVLTAKHCVKEDLKYSEPVKVGVHNIWNETTYTKIKIKEVFYPTASELDVSEPDIAIVLLEKPVNLDDPNIGTVCLPESENKEYVGKTARALGWGLVHPTEKQTQFLKEVDLEVAERYETYFLFTIVHYVDKFIKGKLHKIPQDPCPGDSGGPLLYQDNKKNNRWTIIGTVNGGGYNCYKENRKYRTDGDDGGRWNKVTAHLKWIKGVIEDGTVERKSAESGQKKEKRKTRRGKQYLINVGNKTYLAQEEA